MPTDFCELANSYVSELRARGREIDAARKLPQDIAARLAEDGFYRLCTPQAIAGVGGPPGAAEAWVFMKVSRIPLVFALEALPWGGAAWVAPPPPKHGFL